VDMEERVRIDIEVMVEWDVCMRNGVRIFRGKQVRTAGVNAAGFETR
jgi:hypothetical protein